MTDWIELKIPFEESTTTVYAIYQKMWMNISFSFVKEERAENAYRRVTLQDVENELENMKPTGMWLTYLKALEVELEKELAW